MEIFSAYLSLWAIDLPIKIHLPGDEQTTIPGEANIFSLEDRAFIDSVKAGKDVGLLATYEDGLKATAIACAGFGAVCGDSVATATTMCSVALPEMRKYGYSDQLSLGAISAGGLLGFMIPPSLAFVLYGFFTEESIGSLFIAGILPGALIVLSFIGAIAIVCWRNPAAGPAGPASGWKERLAALYNIWGIIVLFLLVRF